MNIITTEIKCGQKILFNSKNFGISGIKKKISVTEDIELFICNEIIK
jgi:hypothetical protein